MKTDVETINEIHNYNIDISNRDIYINEYDDSGDSAGIDHRMLQNFIKNINILKKYSNDPINIHMQTIGGCWHSGMGIYDCIKRCKCKTNFIGYGQICSMGSVIIQSASKRLITENSILMVHWGNVSVNDQFLNSVNFVSLQKQMAKKMIDIISEKCCKTGKFFKDKDFDLHKTKCFLKRKLNGGDWYLEAEEAVYYGFVDGIVK